MEIIVGRDDRLSQLCLIVEGKPHVIQEGGRLPLSVSRKHCSITPQPDNTYLLKNLNMQNVTYVNGIPVEKKVIKETDKLELGFDHYPLSWSIVKKALPEQVDVSHLPQIYDDFQRTQFNQTRKRERSAAFYSIGGIVSSVGMLVFMLPKEVIGQQLARNIRMGSISVSLIIAFLLLIYRFSTAGKSSEKSKLMRDDFERKYVCPKCGYPLKSITPTQLNFIDHCPHCRVRWIRKK